jgi:fused signal recognition particle receptor
LLGRGGVLVAAAEQYGIPIHAIGLGEGMEDLRPFDPLEAGQAISGATEEDLA